MPTYEYRCEACGKQFTQTERMSQHARRKPACPKCKSKKVVLVFSSFYAMVFPWFGGQVS